jgi:PEGA domain
VNRARGLLAPLAALGLACASPGPSKESTTIFSDPPGARVFVDDAPVGETPVMVELEKRTHRIRLEKDGFDPATHYISVHQRDNPLVWWFIAQLTLSGRYDSKYEFDESYRFVLVPAALP